MKKSSWEKKRLLLNRKNAGIKIQKLVSNVNKTMLKKRKGGIYSYSKLYKKMTGSKYNK